MRLTVSKKLYGLVGILLLVLLSVALTSFFSTGHMIKGFDEVTKEEGVQLEMAQEAKIQLGNAIHWYKNYLIRDDKKYIDRFNKAVEAMKKALEKYEALADTNEEHKLVEEAKMLLAKYALSMDQLIQAKQKTTDIREADRMVKGTDRPLNNAFDKLIKLSSHHYEEHLKELKSDARMTTTLQLIVTIIALAAGLILSIFIVRRIVSSIQAIKEGISEVSEGNLMINIPVKSNDEIGEMIHDFNGMLVRLREMVGKINNITITLASSSEETSATTSQIASGTQQQIQQIEQAATATTEMSRTIMDVAKNASEASEAAKESVSVAGEGKQVVEQTVAGILDIAHTVEESASTIEALGESSKQIGEIINVINDIADQTNLLALNAAIEAARAGEQGRGFAVVADEVRKLAERTAKATEEIAEMIKKIQKETAVSVRSMQNGKRKAEEGIQLAEKAKASLENIVRASERCLDMVQMIATATDEQSAAIDQVTTNMENIAIVSRSSQAAVEQMNQATEELARMASELRTLVSWFKVDGMTAGSISATQQHSLEESVKIEEFAPEHSLATLPGNGHN